MINRVKVICVIIVLFLVTSCSRNKVFHNGYFSIGKSKGVLDNHEIDEASGMVASTLNKGMLWVHNDSGDDTRIFLIDDHGQHHATVYLEGIENRDWEDIARGPGPKPDVSYLYIGDIGDNNAKHKYKFIYRIEEPFLNIHNGDRAVERTIPHVETIKVLLPDGSRDSEALLVDPLTQDIYIFSKREEKAIHVYLLSVKDKREEVYIPTLIMKLPYTQITAADISLDGQEILLKNYKQVFYWKRKKAETIKDALKRKPILLPYATEPQGESIAFSTSNDGYFTVTESVQGKKCHVMFYAKLESLPPSQPVK